MRATVNRRNSGLTGQDRAAVTVEPVLTRGLKVAPSPVVGWRAAEPAFAARVHPSHGGAEPAHGSRSGHPTSGGRGQGTCNDLGGGASQFVDMVVGDGGVHD